MPFDGFISYSHAADGRLAPAVQRGLHRLAKPWHRRRALWIFRDQTGLAVTPKLWTSIQEAMDGSAHFVLLASPEAAQSPWVNREIEHWLATKSPDRILPVVTDGEWNWDHAARDFTAGSTAVPASLRGVFTEEPLFLDLRWARDDLHLSLQHIRFRDAIAQLAAPMHGVSKDELEGEDVRQHRRARRLSAVAAATLALLTLVASLTGVVAVRYADRAGAAAEEARLQQRVASEQRGTAERATEESQRQQENARVNEDRARAAQAETRRQEQLAGEHEALAREASAEAKVQQSLAEEATAEARREQDVARRYRAEADQQQADAERQRKNAEQQKANARYQQELANQATDRAKEQERLAEHHREQARRAEEERKRQERLAREAAEEARRQREAAELQQRIVINQRLMARARAILSEDPRKALMLGVAAQRLHDDPATREQLSHLAMSTPYSGSIGDVADVEALAGQVVATSGDDGTVSLWNTTEPARPVRISTLPAAGTADRTLAASRDGKILVAFDGGPEATRWDVSNPAAPVRLAPLTDPAGITAVNVSPDGRTVATSNRDKNTVLWDVAGPAPAALSTLTGAYPLKFGPDGGIAVTSGAQVAVWDLADRSAPVRRSTIAFDFGTMVGETDIEFNPKLPIVAVEGPYDYIYLYDLSDPAAPRQGDSEAGGPGDTDHTTLAFSTDGNNLAIGDSDGTTTVLSVEPNNGWPWMSAQVAKLVARGGPVRSMTFGPDGRTMATAGDRLTATLWNTRGRYARGPVASIPNPFPARLAGLSFTPDSRSLLGAGRDGTALTWNVSDPAEPVRGDFMQLQSGELEGMMITSDATTMVTVNTASVLTVLDISRPGDPVVLSRIEEPGAAAVWVAALTLDGKIMAVGRGDGRTSLWDMTDRTRPVKLVELPLRRLLMSIAFTPDGRTMAVGEGFNVTTFDVTNKSAPVRLTSVPLTDYTGYSATSLEFSPDGRTLAVGTSDRGITMLWDAADPSQPHRIGILPGISSQVLWSSFSPDGRTLATSGLNNSVVLWDVVDPTTPLRYAVLKDPGLQSLYMVFSPDGRTLVTGGAINTDTRDIMLWDPTVPKDLAADPVGNACTVSGRGLNADEWARYIPELPHRPTC
ncbi:TIR domain-containing protein [Actinoplanes sp. NPDC023801]|uniref:TIR domain-containing protein n=1 Tax=Actinoplanes sp. NPDC023801 TaxID=3154595 RepID=UPI0033F667F5